MIQHFVATSPSLKSDVGEAIRNDGVCVVSQVLSSSALGLLISECYRIQDVIQAEVGLERLRQANEYGVLRCPMKFSQPFMDLLANPVAVEIAESLVSATCILHLQNAFVLPPVADESAVDGNAFQLRFHQDFPRYLNGYLASVNCFFILTEFSERTGATRFIVGSHQKPNPLDSRHQHSSSVPATATPGDMVVFDSTIWHAAGVNTSGVPRLAVNHQYTRSWIRQQIDYTRAIGREDVLNLDDKAQRLLGAWVQVPASLNEFYLPHESRLYRAGQG